MAKLKNKGFELIVKSAKNTIWESNFRTKYKNTTPKDIVKEFTKVIETKISDFAVDRIGELIDIAWYENTLILATFFQRVVSRTPIDEDYYVEYFSGKHKDHKRDENSCKLDWYIEGKSGKLFVYDIISGMGKNVFETYNDKKSIEELENYISHIFKEKRRGYINAKIGNENPHFVELEYGCINGAAPNVNKPSGVNPPSLLKNENGLKHQMVNHRSIQAPYGMLRITLAELEMIKSECKNDREFTRKYVNSKKGRKPKKNTVKAFTKFLKKDGKYNISDLEGIFRNK